MNGERKTTDRRAGWGPVCDVHEIQVESQEKLAEGLTTLAISQTEQKNDVRWIKRFSGGLLSVFVAFSGICTPIACRVQESIETILHDHGDRLTKLEQKHEIMDKYFNPNGGHP